MLNLAFQVVLNSVKRQQIQTIPWHRFMRRTNIGSQNLDIVPLVPCPWYFVMDGPDCVDEEEDREDDWGDVEYEDAKEEDQEGGALGGRSRIISRSKNRSTCRTKSRSRSRSWPWRTPPDEAECAPPWVSPRGRHTSVRWETRRPSLAQLGLDSKKIIDT